MLVWLLGEGGKGDHNWFLVGLTLGRICRGCWEHCDWLTCFGSVRIEPTMAKKKKSILVEIAPIFALSSQTPAKGPSWLKSFYQKFLTGFIFYHLFPTHPSLSPILFHCSNLKYFTKERWKYISFISSQKITFSYL